MKPKPAFEIRTKGRRIKIWANGHVDGVKDWKPCTIINRMPQLVAREVKRAKAPLTPKQVSDLQVALLERAVAKQERRRGRPR